MEAASDPIEQPDVAQNPEYLSNVQRRDCREEIVKIIGSSCEAIIYSDGAQGIAH